MFKQLSHGLDDTYYDFNFREFNHFYSELKQYDLLSFMSKDNLGNGNLPLFEGKYLDYNKFYHAYWWKKVSEKLGAKFKRYRLACDIGGGFGSFAEIFIERGNFKMILIDLPQANCLSSYYLYSKFPDKKFYLNDNYKRAEASLTRISTNMTYLFYHLIVTFLTR